MANGNQRPEYSNDAEIVFLDPKDGIGGQIRRHVQEERPKTRRAQLDATRRQEMRQMAEQYMMDNEIEIIMDQEDDSVELK